MSKHVQIVVQDIPENLRDVLVADASDRDISINEAAVAALAEKYGVEREPSTRPHRGGGTSTQLLLSVPEELRTALRLHAARTGETIRGLVISVLSEGYGIAADDAGRRARTVA
jgi:predicted HicB family RNase H-like nuclease